MKCTPRAARRGALAPKQMPKPIALSVLVLGCFAAQPLFAQERPPEPRQAAETPAAPAQAKPQAAQEPAKETTTTGQPDSQAGGTDTMATVEVVASRPTNKVDRDVYELKNDISVSNASAADILNNVPAVTVDPDGTVALRGNQNVQIMVNGKRDAQFQGQNRGDALNAFPAENIESIEVINVPGAEFGNEGGSGPIINLVLKRTRKPGSRATLNANKGTAKRYNGTLFGEHAAGPYSISSNLSVRQDVRSNYSETQREDLDPLTGNVIGGAHSLRNTFVPSHTVMASSTLTFNVGERDQAGATASVSKRKNDNENMSMTQRFGAGMVPTSDYTSTSSQRAPSENFGLGASYSHKSGEPGEELKFDLRYTGQNNSSHQDIFYDYRLRPARYVTNNMRDTDVRNRILDLSVDYQRVIWETWSLKAGAKVADSKNENATNYLAVNPATGSYQPVPGRISDFESNDRNAAIYGILGTKFFSNTQVQAGIRGEYTELDVRQPLLNEQDKYYYMNWLPSFYVTQDLSDTAQLQLRLSRRIARPNERDLNPNLVYYSDFSARQGNPDLEPVNNDQSEIAYNDQFFNINSSIKVFERRESPVIGNRTYQLPTDPDVIVTSPINFGTNKSVGLDMNFNMRKLFIQGLSANLGATISNDTRMRISNFAAGGTPQELKIHREDIKLRLAYQFATESLQLNVNRRGASLSGQGRNGAMTMTMLSWQHRFSPSLTMNLNVQNVFRSGDIVSDTENEVLRLHTLSSPQPRVVYLGLRYQWGGVTGDERIRNGGRGMFRGGPGGRNGGDGGGDGGFGNGGGGFRNGGGGGF
jgi:outer membrane receptor protein involved in Fe transport